MKPLIVLGIALPLFWSTLGAVATANPAVPAVPGDRLVIVDGATDQVIYDDGRTICSGVTGVHHWRDDYGFRHCRRTMRCR